MKLTVEDASVNVLDCIGWHLVCRDRPPSVTLTRCVVLDVFAADRIGNQLNSRHIVVTLPNRQRRTIDLAGFGGRVCCNLFASAPSFVTYQKIFHVVSLCVRSF
jgi:hypothetical protein